MFCIIIAACVQDCMSAVVPFTTGHHIMTDASALAEEFTSLCKSNPTNITAGKCSTVVAQIANGSTSLARRAGSLCTQLGLCDKSLPQDCTITVKSASTSKEVSFAAKDMSSCTVEGVPKTSADATRLPGFVASLTPLPSGSCSTSGDCGDSTYYECRYASQFAFPVFSNMLAQQ